MAKTLLNARIKHRTDTTANWTSHNPKLFKGEFALEQTNTGFKFKVGDGVHFWNDLPYLDISFDNASITYIEGLKSDTLGYKNAASEFASAANTSKEAAAASALTAQDAMEQLLVLLNNPRLEYDENGYLYINYGGEISDGEIVDHGSILFEILSKISSVRTSESNAANSATSANSSKIAAATSETNAGESATSANEAKETALSYKQAAEAARDLALQYKETVESVAQELVDIRTAPRFEIIDGKIYFNYGGA
ncbi:MAG: hypothetical protein IKN54_01390 [Lachnospiraceae bacterium]|nr:hypothetical protein [Lachnospiraceae bacterium]